MSELEDAMFLHMAHLNFVEHESFSYFNFMPFEVDGRQYNPKYGTIKNIFSKFRKESKIKYYRKSIPAFYQLTESNLPIKSMTLTHMGGIPSVISHNNPLYSKLKNLPMDKRSIHDIRIRLTVPNIYEAFAINTKFPIADYSGDITLPYWNIDNATIQIRIHKTNTVSIILGCTREPFPLDFSGITAFFTTLGQIRGALVWSMVCMFSQDINLIQKSVPHLSDWLITMWHFGRDSLIEVSGEAYHETIETAEHILDRYYTKDLKGRQVLRSELVENPNKNPFDAINEKLDLDTPTSFEDSQLPNIGTNENVRK